MPNFKELISKLSVLKGNLPLLASIIIAVVAVGLFIPTRLISGNLRKQIQQESIGKGMRIRNIEPISKEQWKEEQKYQQAYENDANQIELLAKRSIQRGLLSYEIFPTPRSSSILVFEKFGRHFRTNIDELMIQVKAGQCPTDAEIERGLKSVSNRSRLGLGRQSSPLPTTTSRKLRRSYRMLNEIDSKIVNGICLGKAKSIMVYGNPVDLSGYDFWGGYKYDAGVDEAVKACWYWQLGYWVIEDAIKTIYNLNSNSDNVLTSKVKRLRSIDFGTGRRRAVFSISRRTDSKQQTETEKPSYVLSASDGLTVPYTGRYCDDDIDVIHFNMIVVVSADSVFSFMRQLCSTKEHKFQGFSGEDPEQSFSHNQITILESNISAVDRESVVHELYRYGEDAVVELELICEYIFKKVGYEDIKPEGVKEDLKGEQEQKTGRR